VTTEVITQALVANQQATFGQGRVWYIKSATAALTIVAETARSGATIRRFVNVGAGFKFKAEDGQGWTYLRVLSAVNQVIEIIIGDDDVEVANAVTVSGGVSIQESPSTAVASTAPVALPNGAQTAVVAANPARRRVSLQLVSTALGPVDLRTVGGANTILEMQPGVAYELKTIAGFDINNTTGGATTVLVFEET
jgi:hypothetical protein